MTAWGRQTGRDPGIGEPRGADERLREANGRNLLAHSAGRKRVETTLVFITQCTGPRGKSRTELPAARSALSLDPLRRIELESLSQGSAGTIAVCAQWYVHNAMASGCHGARLREEAVKVTSQCYGEWVLSWAAPA